MDDLSTLAGLARLVRGERPQDLDWRATVDLANRAFVTPALAGLVDDAPEEIQAFVAEVCGRNLERNRRLGAQLEDVAGVLTGAGLSCTLLKGARILAAGGAYPARRLISDLDLQVAPTEVPAALEALAAAGFRTFARYDADDSHVAAELFRDDDVGMVDLHRRPPGPRHILSRPDVAGRTQRMDLGAVQVDAPRAELQLLHLALHDQLHDGDYWSGVFDLRHLLDTAELTRGPEPVDWSLFDGHTLGHFGRTVVCRQLFAAHRLFGARVPAQLLGEGGGLQYWRSSARLAWPALRTPLALGALAMAAPAALAHYRREARWRSSLQRPSSVAERRRGRLARLRGAFSPPRDAKV